MHVWCDPILKNGTVCSLRDPLEPMQLLDVDIATLLHIITS